MKKHRFLVLPLLFLALVCMGLVAVPRASAHTLQSTPPNPAFTGGACTPEINVVEIVFVSSHVMTIKFNNCARLAMIAGITPNDLATFTVTYASAVSPQSSYSPPEPTSHPVPDGLAQTSRGIVATELSYLEAEFANCPQMDDYVLTHWDDSLTTMDWLQQISANAELLSLECIMASSMSSSTPKACSC